MTDNAANHDGEPPGALDEVSAPGPTDRPAPASEAAEPTGIAVDDPTPAPEESEAGEPGQLLSPVLARLEDRLAESQRLLARQVEIAAGLHAENLRLKEGELRKAQMPLIRDMLRVHDDVAGMLASSVEPAAGRELDLIRCALVDALARSGIEPVACETGDAFDPKAHKVVGVEPTGDADANRTIAGVARPGFAWDDGAVVRVSEVKVYKYRPAPVEPLSTATGPASRADHD